MTPSKFEFLSCCNFIRSAVGCQNFNTSLAICHDFISHRVAVSMPYCLLEFYPNKASQVDRAEGNLKLRYEVTCPVSMHLTTIDYRT